MKVGDGERLPHQERQSPRSFTMDIAQLSEAVLNDIVSIYIEVTGSRLAQEFVETDDPDQKLDYIADLLSSGNTVSWRFGDRVSTDSKFSLWKGGQRGGIQLVQFSFDPNNGVSDPSGVRTEELAQMVNDFRDKVNQYLVQKQLVIS